MATIAPLAFAWIHQSVRSLTSGWPRFRQASPRGPESRMMTRAMLDPSLDGGDNFLSSLGRLIVADRKGCQRRRGFLGESLPGGPGEESAEAPARRPITQ